MIYHRIGDVTNPVPMNVDAVVVIPHVVNNQGGWGAGLTGALSKAWPSVEKDYRSWAKGIKDGIPFDMGQVLFSRVDTSRNIRVVHMLAQNGYKGYNNPVPLDYDALRFCMSYVAIEFEVEDAPNSPVDFEIHMPRFGCGLAGGLWSEIESYIDKFWHAYDVVVYDLSEADAAKY